MYIEEVTTDQLIKIVAGLVRKGIHFEVKPSRRVADHWDIRLTGGY
jgi:hypothetical protein